MRSPLPDNKAERFNIRATRSEKTLVEQAARASHMTSSQFVMQAALRSAEEVLAEQTRFVLPPDRWDEFAARLDCPARTLPRLREAVSKPSPFGER
jgi:uncharacterized protein (DUF1778 family)